MPRKFLSKLLKRPQEEQSYVRPSLERSDSTESIASDATDPNNPGPGRNVGLVYDALGARLERFLDNEGASQRAQLVFQRVPSQSESGKSIASDATGPNNAGPGRNLGLLYDSVGGRIELLLNSTAGKFKHSPQALAADIRSRLRYNAFIYPENATQAPTDKEYSILKKKCRKLLKYCRSHLLKTQLEALDVVAGLAIEDPYVRRVLAGILHDSYLIPNYTEKELYVANSKALISIRDNEVHEFWSNFTQRFLANDPGFSQLEKQLPIYMRDPDISFVIGRLLLRESEGSPIHLEWFNTTRIYLETAAAHPQVIEWESLREVFMYGIVEVYYALSSRVVFELARHFPILQLPEIGSVVPVGLHYMPQDEFEAQDFLIYAHWMIEFLENLCGTEDLFTQFRYLHGLGEEEQKIFHGTVFTNEILIACLRAFHDSGCSFPCFQYIPASGRVHEAAVMLHYYLRGAPDERALAKMAITASMNYTRYFRCAFVSLVSRRSDSAELLATFSHPRNLPLKVLDLSVDNFYQRDGFSDNIFIQCAGEGRDMYPEDSLIDTKSESLFIWLEVLGNKNPFDVTGHFPIIAGYDAFGQEIYVAKVDVSRGLGLTYVSDGARSVSFVDRRGKIIASHRFFVLVLKRDPCDLEVGEVPEGAKFQTGPAYWVREEKEEQAHN